MLGTIGLANLDGFGKLESLTGEAVVSVFLLAVEPVLCVAGNLELNWGFFFRMPGLRNLAAIGGDLIISSQRGLVKLNDLLSLVSVRSSCAFVLRLAS